MFWASEAWMLHVASGKANVKIVQPMQLPVDTLLSLKATTTGYEEVEGSGTKLYGHVTSYQDDWWSNYGGNRRGNVNTKPPQYEKVVFEVIGEINSEFGLKDYSYTLGEIVFGQHKGEFVKIYASHMPILRELLDTSTGMFIGETSGTFQEYIQSTGKYRTTHNILPNSVKVNSLKLIADKSQKGDRKLVDGILLTEKEFDKKCKLGCAWCTDLPKFKYAEEVLFNRDGSEFLCENCNTPENRKYFDYDEEKLA